MGAFIYTSYSNYNLEVCGRKWTLIVSNMLDLKLDLMIAPYWTVTGNFVTVHKTLRLSTSLHWAIGNICRLRFSTFFQFLLKLYTVFHKCWVMHFRPIVTSFTLTYILQLMECKLDAIR
jgi:hypothetical protein